METRKIYMTGGSTYVVSLPKRWVKNSGLKKGDSVVVTAQEGSIIIEPGEVERRASEIEIRMSDVPSLDALKRLIIAYYLVGYDTIKILLDKKKGGLDYKEGIRKSLRFLVGVEIVEDIGDSITMEILLDHQRMPTPRVLKRVYLINKSMLMDMITAFENLDRRLAEDVVLREREIDRLYFLVVRQLKSAVRFQRISENLGITYQRDSLGYRIAIKSFERIADHLENIAESFITLMVAEKEVDTTKFLELAPVVKEMYENAALAFFRQDAVLVDEVFKKAKEIDRIHLRVSNELFDNKEVNVQSSILQKTILDSLSRIAGYSTDIAEIAINMSVKVP